MSWYSNPNNKQQGFADDLNPKNVFKFSVKPKESKKFLFLDDAQFQIWEATLKVGGTFRTFTADSGNPQDPLVLAAAQGRIRLNLREYYTVIDLTPYKAKDGSEKTMSKKAVCVPKTLFEKVARKRSEAGGSLVGCIFTAHRDTDKEAGCGSDWVFDKKIDIQEYIRSGKIAADLAKPYDFPDLLKPMNSAVVKSALDSMGDNSYLAPSGVFDSSPTQTDDIPF